MGDLWALFTFIYCSCIQLGHLLACQLSGGSWSAQRPVRALWPVLLEKHAVYKGDGPFCSPPFNATRTVLCTTDFVAQNWPITDAACCAWQTLYVMQNRCSVVHFGPKYGSQQRWGTYYDVFLVLKSNRHESWQSKYVDSTLWQQQENKSKHTHTHTCMRARARATLNK